MNRYDRVAEHLDKISINHLRFCMAKHGCACMGLAGCGNINGGPLREHELIKYVQGTITPGQFPRKDIHDRIQKELSKHGDPADFIGQYDWIEDGRVWRKFIHRQEQTGVDIQITGPIPGETKLHIWEYKPST